MMAGAGCPVTTENRLSSSQCVHGKEDMTQ